MWWESVIVAVGLAIAAIYAIVFARRMFSQSDGCGCGHGTCDKKDTGASVGTQDIKVTPLVELKTPNQQK